MASGQRAPMGTLACACKQTNVSPRPPTKVPACLQEVQHSSFNVFRIRRENGSLTATFLLCTCHCVDLLLTLAHIFTACPYIFIVRDLNLPLRSFCWPCCGHSSLSGHCPALSSNLATLTVGDYWFHCRDCSYWFLSLTITNMARRYTKPILKFSHSWKPHNLCNRPVVFNYSDFQQWFDTFSNSWYKFHNFAVWNECW